MPSALNGLQDRGMACRRVWQYAIKAVLQDVKKPSRWLSFAEMSKWQLQRKRYEKLHLRRIETLARAGEPEVVGAISAQGCIYL